MLDLHDSPSSSPADLLAVFGLRGLPPATAPRGYAGPDRRQAAALQQRRMAQLLDMLDYGLLLLSDGQQVSHVNKAARRDMDEHHALQLVGGHLQARLTKDLQPLRDALAGATQRGLRRLLQLGEGPHRISVAVVPLPALGEGELPGAAVLLGKRQVCEELTVDWFARSHGLTGAETVVMKGLCADLTPQQIAERQGVGLATVRTQIGSIRLKTGACSIRALVRQVALLPPLVSALQAPSAAPAAGPMRAWPASGAAQRLQA